MKKTSFYLFIIISSLLFNFISCKNSDKPEELSWFHYTEQLTQRTFDTSKTKEELSRPREINENSENIQSIKLPFTLNFEGCPGEPVVCISMEDQDVEHKFYFLIDSGSSRNWFYKSFITKMGMNEDEFIEEILDEPHEDINTSQLISELILNHPDRRELINFIKEQLSQYNYLSVFLIKDESGLTLKYDRNHNCNFDGILGQDFMYMFDRVTIDYINNYIILDDDRLDGYAIPFYSTDNNPEFHIHFKYRGKDEIAIVDTGNCSFNPREGFGDGHQVYDINADGDYGIESQQKTSSSPRVMYTYNNIVIGDIRYDNIKGYYSNVQGTGYNKGAIAHMMKVSNLGDVFFYIT